MDIINNILLGMTGVMLYFLIKFTPHLSTEKIKTKVFWSAIWLTASIKTLWLLITISIISFIVVSFEGIDVAIQTATGLDVKNNVASFFTLGLALAGTVDNKN